MRKTVRLKMVLMAVVVIALSLTAGANAALANEPNAADVEEQLVVEQPVIEPEDISVEDEQSEETSPVPVSGWEKQSDGRWVYHVGDALATGLYYCGGAGTPDTVDVANWYLFDTQGYLITGKTGWYLDGATSRWVYLTGGKGHVQMSGWLKSGSKWYYFVDGYMVSNEILSISGARYHFDNNGRMTTGWFKAEGHWLYFSANGKQLQKGWVASGGKWYYIGHDYVDNIDGVMVTNTCVCSSGKFYFMDSTGAMRTGWLHVQIRNQGTLYVETKAGEPGIWMWADASGKLFVKGWKQVGSKWYYFEEFAMYTGELTYKGDLYYMRDNGAMATGWVDLDGWHYFNSKGRAVNGWQKIGSAWYYFDYGVMAADYLLEDAKGRLYYLKENGAMATNMVFVYDGVAYRADGSGLVRPIR